MDIILNLWSGFLLIGTGIFYISVVVLLILLEKHFIRKRSKGEILLPAAALAAAVLLTVFTFSVSTFRSSGLVLQEVIDGNEEAGHLWLVHDGDRRLQAVGEFITNEGQQSRFIELTFDQNGKIIHTSQPVSCRQEIEDTLSMFKGKPSGRSLTYEELVPLGEKAESRGNFVDGSTLLNGGLWYGVPVLILFGQYFTQLLRRKKRNAYDKTRLEDL